MAPSPLPLFSGGPEHDPVRAEEALELEQEWFFSANAEAWQLACAAEEIEALATETFSGEDEIPLTFVLYSWLERAQAAPVRRRARSVWTPPAAPRIFAGALVEMLTSYRRFFGGSTGRFRGSEPSLPFAGALHTRERLGPVMPARMVRGFFFVSFPGAPSLPPHFSPYPFNR